ncbi:MAG: hypothetical protein HY347_09995 [candidate division NC10 bacterium]|nr:hypothetical protein [candidate division NC10 bacterium]
MWKATHEKISISRLVSIWFGLIVMVAGCRAVQPMGGEAPLSPNGSNTILIVGGQLNPRVLTIPPESTVTWVVADWPVEITLLTPARLCGPPSGFRRTEEGTYLSSILQTGSRASLCFAEPGTYDYEAFIRGGGGRRRSDVAMRFNRTLIGQIQVR